MNREREEMAEVVHIHVDSSHRLAHSLGETLVPRRMSETDGPRKDAPFLSSIIEQHCRGALSQVNVIYMRNPGGARVPRSATARANLQHLIITTGGDEM